MSSRLMMAFLTILALTCTTTMATAGVIPARFWLYAGNWTHMSAGSGGSRYTNPETWQDGFGYEWSEEGESHLRAYEVPLNKRNHRMVIMEYKVIQPAGDWPAFTNGIRDGVQNTNLPTFVSLQRICVYESLTISVHYCGNFSPLGRHQDDHEE